MVDYEFVINQVYKTELKCKHWKNAEQLNDNDLIYFRYVDLSDENASFTTQMDKARKLSEKKHPKDPSIRKAYNFLMPQLSKAMIKDNPYYKTSLGNYLVYFIEQL